MASGASLTHCYVSHQCIPAARVFARAGMASGRRGDLVGLDLTSSATRTWTVIATSPSVCGHLDLARHRGWAPASPRNHQLDRIWVGVVSPPFHKRVWACDGSRRVFLAQVCWVWLFEALGARSPCSRGLAHWAGPMGSPACVSLKPRSFRCLRVWALAMDWLKYCSLKVLSLPVSRGVCAWLVAGPPAGASYSPAHTSFGKSKEVGGWTEGGGLLAMVMAGPAAFPVNPRASRGAQYNFRSNL